MKAYMSAFLFCVSLVSAGIYTGDPEYGVGGQNTATIVIDFDFGNSFLFKYTWDGQSSSYDALKAIDTAGDLEITATEYSFGAFVSDFSYPGGVKYDYGDANTGWAFYTSEDNETWQLSMAGPSDRILADGSWDSWVWSKYSDDWMDVQRAPGMPPVPEPATLLLLSAGSLIIFTKRS